MNRISIVAVAIASLVASATLAAGPLAGVDLAARVRGYLAARGVDPDESYRVIITPDAATDPRYQRLGAWDFAGIPEPTEDTLPTLAQAAADIAAFRTAQEAARQAAKPAERKAYERAFFDMTEQLLTLTSDPLAGQEPPVKLGFPAIQTLIEALQTTDPMAAINFSLKLLTIDAALKRYDVLWWEDAIYHVAPGE